MANIKNSKFLNVLQGLKKLTWKRGFQVGEISKKSALGSEASKCYLSLLRSRFGIF